MPKENFTDVVQRTIEYYVYVQPNYEVDPILLEDFSCVAENGGETVVDTLLLPDGVYKDARIVVRLQKPGSGH